MGDAALSGLRVVEVGNSLAARYAGRLLAAYGADVVRLEAPRTAASEPLDAAPHPERRLLDAFLNRGKRAVAASHGEDAVAKLATGAGILLHDLTAEERAAWPPDGALPVGLREVAVTPYGAGGPYAAYRTTPLTEAAAAGWMYSMGDANRPPLYPGGAYIAYIGGVTAAIAALMPEGEPIAGTADRAARDVSSIEAGVWCLPYPTLEFSCSGTQPTRTGPLHAGNPLTPILPCRDGYIQFGPVPARQTERFLELVGGRALATDGRFATPALRTANARELVEILRAWAAGQARHDLFALLASNRVPAAFVPDASEIAGLAPHVERRWFHTAPAGPLAGLPAPGPPVRLHDAGWNADDEQATTLEEAIGSWIDRVPRARPSPLWARAGARPLAGLQVVEIAQGWAGPLIGALLADYGADVIKVESGSHPDWWRGGPRSPEDATEAPHERAWYFNGVNRNKRGITLELQRDEGRSLLLALLAKADVLIENFTPAAIRRLRLTYDDVAATNPRLVMVSMPGFGLTGSWRDYPALGTTVDSMCGIQSAAGYEDGEPRINSISWDPVVGLHGAFGVLAALAQRARTGRGQLVEVSHLEAGTQLFAEHHFRFLATGEVPRPRGNSSDAWAPHGVYPARGDDQWVAIAVEDDAQWASLCDVLDRAGESLRQPRFATQPGRHEHAHDLDGLLGSLTVARDAGELFHALQQRGVPCSPVMHASELLGDDHLHARGFFVGIDREHVGHHLYPGLLFSGAGRPEHWRPAPTLGQHNREVLMDRLGLTEADLARLNASGIIGTVPDFITAKGANS